MNPARIQMSALALAALLASGCEIRKAMFDQPKYKALQASEFFGDGRSARPLVEGTVARGFLRADKHLYEGVVDGKPAEAFPFAVTAADLARGRERFNIYCSPCHDQAGTGNGMVVQRGFKVPPSYHIARLREAPPGYIYDVITRGFGQMSSYAAQVPPEDRWRIVAYVRALQLSQNAKLEDVPEPLRASLH
jgi:mono/diheme cytochrome c family protein